MKQQLAGKIALVTGASRGIGKAIADAFEDAGAQTIRVSRTVGYDVSDEQSIERLFGEIKQRYGRLDILINNAGLLTPRKPIVDVTTKEWDDSLAVNLRAVFLCTRAALELMIPAETGLIINVSSGAGKRAAPQWGPYAVAKWGVEGFTKSVAEEVRSYGVQIVSVNPGATRTQMRALAYPEEDPTTLKPAEELAPYFVALATGQLAFQSGDSLDFSPLTSNQQTKR